jgi:hypothetical protein
MLLRNLDSTRASPPTREALIVQSREASERKGDLNLALMWLLLSYCSIEEGWKQIQRV